MPVQWVNRPHSGFRGYAGRIAGGVVRVGDKVVLLPSRQTSTVESIVTFDGALDQAVEGQSVTLTLADEIDCSRGDVVVAASAPDALAEGFAASLVWMAEEALVPGQSYWLKIGSQTLSATIDKIDHVVDVDTLARGAGRPLGLNDIGRCEIGLDRAIAPVAYVENRQLGGFILIDKLRNATVAAGMVEEALAASSGARASADAASRIYWLADGGEAFAARLRERLHALGRPCAILDEAGLRAGLCADLGAGEADGAEIIRRARETAKLMAGAGMYVLVALAVPAAEARPGRQVDPATFEQEGADQWVI
jgi:bifunctional enzyme CysN/CysC